MAETAPDTTAEKKPAGKFPGGFVDPKSGNIRSFRTAWDRIQDDVLPNAAHFGLLGAKVALLAPFVGGLAIAVPAAAALWWGTREIARKGLDLAHDKIMDQHRKGQFSEYDFTKPEDKAAFERRFADTHPHLADDYLAMAKRAKLSQVPKLMIIEPYFREQGRSRFSSMVSDFMAAATTRPTGKDPKVILGRGALSDLKADEMRAVIGHEFTHVKLGHMKETVNWMGRFSLNNLVNGGLIAAALIGVLPFAPVLGLIGVTGVVGVCLKSIQSRRHEELCDRGAALLTGGTADLSSALGKIKKAMTGAQEAETAARYRERGLDPPESREVRGLSWFVNATHPTNEARDRKLQGFEKKYPGYCETQRGSFKHIFNQLAYPPAPPVAPAPEKPAEPEAKKPDVKPEAKKPTPPKIKYIRIPKWGFGY